MAEHPDAAVTPQQGMDGNIPHDALSSQAPAIAMPAGGPWTVSGMERRLAAILSTDVKEYSRLMGEDEVATIYTLTAYREVMASLIQQHRGITCWRSFPAWSRRCSARWRSNGS